MLCVILARIDEVDTLNQQALIQPIMLLKEDE